MLMLKENWNGRGDLLGSIFCKRDWEVRFLIKEKQKRDREAGREMNYKTKRAMGRLCYLFGEEFRVWDILYFLNKKIP